MLSVKSQGYNLTYPGWLDYIDYLRLKFQEW